MRRWAIRPMWLKWRPGRFSSGDIISHATEYARVFLRGWLLVSLVAANTWQIAHERDLAAIGGFLISVVWWYNARNAGRSSLPGAGLAYGLGAAAGTLTGLHVARWLAS